MINLNNLKSKKYSAGEYIERGSACIMETDGTVYLFDITDSSHTLKYIGVAFNTCSQGQIVEIIQQGFLGWNGAPYQKGVVYYIGLDSKLTSTPPISGTIKAVAVGLPSTVINGQPVQAVAITEEYDGTGGGGGTWGSITGVITDQTDLITYLGSNYYPLSNPNNYIDGTQVPSFETDPVFTAWLLTSPLSGYVPTSRSINISGVTQDLSANRTWLFDYQQNTTPTGTGTSSIIVGAKWFHTDSGRIYEYVYDGDTYQWVSPTLPTATGATGPSGPNNVDTSTTTPINGILKGNGVNVAVATPNVDYQAALGYTAFNVANIDTDATFAANSDSKVASQKAVKTAFDNYNMRAMLNFMNNQRVLFNF